jgi:histidinol dehydrogenase
MTTGNVVRVIDGLDGARAFVRRPRDLDTAELPDAVRESIEKMFGEPLTAAQVVERIVRDVRTDGDLALRHYSRLIDHADIDELRVTPDEFQRARQEVEPEVYAALEFSRERIVGFHRRQLRSSWIHFDDDGAVGQVLRPLDRVGIYTPAGRAPYPSSLLMTAVPARVAGVEEVIVCVPPAPSGEVSPIILAAAEIAGVDAVYKVGGAQAIAALAYGTESIPRVDKILGPGNIFVVLAKKRVYGDVDIDQLPGPTETMLIADDSANPALCAADMLAQAEHDPMASAILITTSQLVAARTRDALRDQIDSLERAEIAAASLRNTGAILVVPDLDSAFALANDYAPEHLCLLIRDPWSHIDRVRHAGGIFVGETSPEVIGDYTGGPSHVMPTGRTARFSSPVNVEEFLKIISLLGVNQRGLARLGPTAATIARSEGLTAHARAVERRIESEQ